MKKTCPHSEQGARYRQSIQWFCIACLACVSGLLSGCEGLIERTEQSDPAQTSQIIQITPRTATTQPARSNRWRAEPVAVLDESYPLAGQANDLWQRIRPGLRLLDQQHPRITHEIERLQRNPKALKILLNRSIPYLHYILEQVEKNNLPHELALLPAVESGFRPFARSRNGAAGLWQFMPATGRMLGLRQHWWYDGRQDVVASTRAALDYLVRLKKRFDGDWLYALAAYNAGSGTVNRAIGKALENHQPQDYWSLDLPQETNNYIPRLIALSKIVYAPGRYGLSLPEAPNQAHFVIVPNRQQIDLQVAANLADMPLQKLLDLNPAFMQGVTYPKSAARLLLPVDRQDQFKQALAALPQDKLLRWRQHTIRRGDTLSGIASSYNLSVSALRQANNLTGSRIRAGRKLLVPLSNASAVAQAKRKTTKEKVRYHVRKGDSLYTIARKFQVKIADLRRWNKVSRLLHPGQKLTVYPNRT